MDFNIDSIILEAKKSADKNVHEKVEKVSVDLVFKIAAHKLREDGIFVSSYKGADTTLDYVKDVIDKKIEMPKITADDEKLVEKLYKAYLQPYNQMGVYKEVVKDKGEIDKKSLPAIIDAIGKTATSYKLIDTFSEKFKERKAKEDVEALERGEEPKEYTKKEENPIFKEIEEYLKDGYLGEEGKIVKFKLKSVSNVFVTTMDADKPSTIRVTGFTIDNHMVIVNIPFERFDENDKEEKTRLVTELLDIDEVKFNEISTSRKLRPSEYKLNSDVTIEGMVGGQRIAVKKDDDDIILLKDLKHTRKDLLDLFAKDHKTYIATTYVAVGSKSKVGIDLNVLKLSVYNRGIQKLKNTGTYLGDKHDSIKFRIGKIAMVGHVEDKKLGPILLVTGKSDQGKWFTAKIRTNDKEAIGKIFSKFPDEKECAESKFVSNQDYTVKVGAGIHAEVDKLAIKKKGEDVFSPINPIKEKYAYLKSLIDEDKVFYKECTGISFIRIDQISKDAAET